MRWDFPLDRVQIERAERVAVNAERERLKRRQERDRRLQRVTALVEGGLWERPSSLATVPARPKKTQKKYTFTDRQMQIAMGVLSNES